MKVRRENNYTHLVPWDDTAPESDVCPTLTARSSLLLLEIGGSGGGWDRVERHVDKSRDTARCSCACSGPEPFPVGTSGLIEVNMGTAGIRAGQEEEISSAVEQQVMRQWEYSLNEAWQYDMIPCIKPICVRIVRADGEAVPHINDFARQSVDEDGGWDRLVVSWEDDAVAGKNA